MNTIWHIVRVPKLRSSLQFVSASTTRSCQTITSRVSAKDARPRLKGLMVGTLTAAFGLWTFSPKTWMDDADRFSSRDADFRSKESMRLKHLWLRESQDMCVEDITDAFAVPLAALLKPYGLIPPQSCVHTVALGNAEPHAIILSINSTPNRSRRSPSGEDINFVEMAGVLQGYLDEVTRDCPDRHQVMAQVVFPNARAVVVFRYAVHDRQLEVMTPCRSSRGAHSTGTYMPRLVLACKEDGTMEAVKESRDMIITMG